MERFFIKYLIRAVWLDKCMERFFVDELTFFL